jgi:hypothetical protein
VCVFSYQLGSCLRPRSRQRLRRTTLHRIHQPARTHTHTHTPSTNATDPRHSPLLSPQLGTRHAFTRCMRALSPRVPRCRHRAGARVAWYVGFGFRLEAWHTPYRTCMRAFRPHEWIFLLALRPSPCAPMPLSPQLSPSPCLWHLI